MDPHLPTIPVLSTVWASVNNRFDLLSRWCLSHEQLWNRTGQQATEPFGNTPTLFCRLFIDYKDISRTVAPSENQNNLFIFHIKVRETSTLFVKKTWVTETDSTGWIQFINQCYYLVHLRVMEFKVALHWFLVGMLLTVKAWQQFQQWSVLEIVRAQQQHEQNAISTGGFSECILTDER